MPRACADCSRNWRIAGEHQPYFAKICELVFAKKPVHRQLDVRQVLSTGDSVFRARAVGQEGKHDLRGEYGEKTRKPCKELLFRFLCYDYK